MLGMEKKKWEKIKKKIASLKNVCTFALAFHEKNGLFYK